MAVTKGHGNPNWSREETLLALELYFDLGLSIPDASDQRIKDLSRLLRALPHRQGGAKQATFRNYAGVTFKLRNLHAARTGIGLKNFSKTDQAIWDEFGKDPDRVRSIANLIRSSSTEPLNTDDFADEDGDEHPEGATATRLHRKRERNRKVRRSLLKHRRRRGGLKCDICSFQPQAPDSALEDAPFETHHLVPLATTGARLTGLTDLALLCANCHRLLHRAITLHKRWLTVAEAKSLIAPTDK